MLGISRRSILINGEDGEKIRSKGSRGTKEHEEERGKREKEERMTDPNKIPRKLSGPSLEKSRNDSIRRREVGYTTKSERKSLWEGSNRGRLSGEGPAGQKKESKSAALGKEKGEGEVQRHASMLCGPPKTTSLALQEKGREEKTRQVIRIPVWGGLGRRFYSWGRRKVERKGWEQKGED